MIDQAYIMPGQREILSLRLQVTKKEREIKSMGCLQSMQ